MFELKETIEEIEEINNDSRNQNQRLLNFVLVSVLIVLKIFDLSITIFGLLFGVIELNPLGDLFYENPQLIMLISFFPIFIGLLSTILVKKDLVILKMISYGLLAFNLLLFFIILSNLCQLTYML